MAASFTLELDTTAPEVDFGAVSGSLTPLTVRYFVDEPRVTDAWLVDNAGDSWQMAVESDQLSIMVSDLVARGLGRIEAETLDDVGNVGLWSRPFNVGTERKIVSSTRAVWLTRLRDFILGPITGAGDSTNASTRPADAPIERVQASVRRAGSGTEPADVAPESTEATDTDDLIP